MRSRWSGAAAEREVGESIDDALDRTITEAATWLAEQQAEDGHWVFELEADATMPSEYVFLNHYLGEIDTISSTRSPGICGEPRGRTAVGGCSLAAIST
jgi:hypothetical protein